MKIKTTPAVTGAISLDAFDTGIKDESNDTQNSTNFKQKKQPIIFADTLNPRTRTARLHHVFLGPDAIERAEAAFEMMSYRTPSIIYVMPWDDDPSEYTWNVEGKTLDILSAGRHFEEVQMLGDALQAAGAKHIYARADGYYLVWDELQQLEVA